MLNTLIPDTTLTASKLVIDDNDYGVSWDDTTTLSYVIDSQSKYMISRASNFVSNGYAYQAVGSLLATENWTTFVSDAYAESAIGSPTLEMWVDSWNTVYDATNYPSEQLYCNNGDSNGYYLGTTDTPTSTSVNSSKITVMTGYGNTLYFPRTTTPSSGDCRGYWLAAPAAGTSENHKWFVYYSGNFGSDGDVDPLALRPVVCLNSGVGGTLNGDVWELQSSAGTETTGVPVESATAPTLKIKFGSGTERTATFKSASGNKITYTYTIQEGDNGLLTSTEYTGTVYDLGGNTLEVSNMSLTGHQVTADTILPLWTKTDITTDEATQTATVTLQGTDINIDTTNSALEGGDITVYVKNDSGTYEANTAITATVSTATTITNGLQYTVTLSNFDITSGEVALGIANDALIDLAGNTTDGTLKIELGTIEFDTTGPVLESIDVIKPTSAETLVSQIEGNESTEYGAYTNYPVDIDGDTTDNDWRIFYSDEASGNVFLIADDYVPNTMIPDDKLTALGMTRSTSYETYGVYWASAPGSSLSYTISDSKYMISRASTFTTTTNNNYQAVGSLLATENWTPFVNTTYATDAIGGPTVEMWVASWNTVYPDDTLYCNNADVKGYYVGTIDTPTSTEVDNSEKEGYNNTMYYPHQSRASDGTAGYWLASPSAYATRYVLNVGQWRERLVLRLLRCRLWRSSRSLSKL